MMMDFGKCSSDGNALMSIETEIYRKMDSELKKKKNNILIYENAV